MTHEVIDNAEKFFKMRRTRLRSGTRVRQYVEARQMITAVLREDYKLQWARIGGLINRHHATIIHLHNNHKNDIVQSFSYARQYDNFRDACGLVEDLPRREATALLYNIEDAKSLNERIEIISKALKNYKQNGRFKMV